MRGGGRGVTTFFLSKVGEERELEKGGLIDGFTNEALFFR